MLSFLFAWVIAGYLVGPRVTCAGAMASESDDGQSRPSRDAIHFQKSVDNPYFPLLPGTRFIYAEMLARELSTNEVTVTSESRLVMGVACVVVRERVTVGGRVEAEIDRWYAQDDQGNVWYFGQETQEISSRPGADPGDSWVAGENGAQAGVIMPGPVKPSQPYRLTYGPDSDEGQGQIQSAMDSVTVPFGSIRSCVLIKEWSVLRAVAAKKWYARGIGLVRCEGTSPEGRTLVVLKGMTRP